MLTGPPSPPSGLTSPDFWTIAEVAAMARVSKMTIHRLISNGDLKHTRIGRSIRIYGHSVTTYFGLTPARKPTP